MLKDLQDDADDRKRAHDDASCIEQNIPRVPLVLPRLVDGLCAHGKKIMKSLSTSQECIGAVAMLLGDCLTQTWEWRAIQLLHPSEMQQVRENTNSNASDDDTPISPCQCGKQSQLRVFMSRTQDGHTPLMLAALNGHDDCVKLLLQEGASVMMKTTHAVTAQHLAATQGFNAVLEVLLQDPACDFAVTELHGNHILHQAVCNGHPACVRVALHNFSSKEATHSTFIDAVNDVGYSPLLLAARHGQADCIMELVGVKASTSLKSPDGYSSLHLAAVNGHAPCISSLLTSITGVELHAAKDELDSLYKRLKGVERRIAQCELDELRAVNVWSMDKCENTKQLIEQAEQLVMETKLNASILEADIVRSQQRIQELEQCMSRDATPLRSIDIDEFIDGHTALHLAAMANAPQCVEVLLKFRAQINLRNKNSLTSCLIASLNGHYEVVDVLARCGADMALIGHEVVQGSIMHEQLPETGCSGTLYSGYSSPEWTRRRGSPAWSRRREMIGQQSMHPG